MSETIHSATGASSMERWEPCPGSTALIPLVDKRSTDYADEGTQAHTIASDVLMTGRYPTVISDEMYHAVKYYVDKCNSYISVTHRAMGAIFGVEYRFRVNEDIYGTIDFWAYWPWLKRLIVIDFKYGAGIYVDVRDNLQCQYYGTSMLQLFSQPVDTIEVGIVQPRCMVGTEIPPFRTTEYTREQLQAFYTQRMLPGIEATKSPFAPLVTGPHCAKTFCPASAICPQMQAEGKQALITPSVPCKGQRYDPNELAYWLTKRDALKRFIRSLDEFAYAELQAGRKIPGFKLVAKRAQRRYKDSSAMAQKFELFGAGDDVYEQRVLKSPNQIETTAPQWAFLLEDMTEKESSGFNLAPDKDERPAVENGPAAGFQPIVINPTAEALALFEP